jgi:tetratricopeptide (TPR) repeat protein
LLARTVPALFAILVYSNALSGTFHFDDAHAVVHNPAIRSAEHPERFFTDASAFSILPQNQSYRPLLLLTYALTAEAAGVSAPAFIAVNLLVHVLCVLLFQAVLRRVLPLLGYRTDERLLLVASALFAVHPLFSECVNYVSARSESLCALFALFAIAAYLRARETGHAAWSACASAALFSAFLVKPVAISVPFLALLLEASAAQRQPWRRVLRRLLWLVVPAAAGMLLTLQMTPALAVASASPFSKLDYARSELPAILYYLGLFVWPARQNADHVFPASASALDPRVMLSMLALGWAGVFIARSLASRRYLGVAVAAGWFLICILPSSSVFPLAELVAERRPYLAAAGLCPLFAAALLHGTGRTCSLRGRAHRTAGYLASVAVIATFATLTVARNRVWKTEEALWLDIVSKAPESARAQMNYGLTLMKKGHLAEAENYLRAAVRLAPNYSYAHLNLGTWLVSYNRIVEARGEFDRALALSPDLVYAHYRRGLLGERLHESPEVRATYFRHATELSPNHADAQYQLARALLEAGDSAGSEQAARTAERLRGSPQDHVIRARALLKLGAAGSLLARSGSGPGATAP